MTVEKQIEHWRAGTGRFRVSRHVVTHVQRLLTALGQGTYNDAMVKELLILVREFVRDELLPKQTGSVEAEFHLLLDVCDFIAHPNRFKGTSHNRIVEVLLRLVEAYENGGPLDSDPFDASIVAWRLLGAANILLESGDAARPDIPEFSEVFCREIGASILCNLQDCRVVLSRSKDAGGRKGAVRDVGVARLNVAIFDGELRLYASVDVHEDLRRNRNLVPKGISFALFRSFLDFSMELPLREVPAYVCSFKGRGRPLEIALVDPAVGDGCTLLEFAPGAVFPSFKTAAN